MVRNPEARDLLLRTDTAIVAVDGANARLPGTALQPASAQTSSEDLVQLPVQVDLVIQSAQNSCDNLLFFKRRNGQQKAR
jgi:hypothetical protein